MILCILSMASVTRLDFSGSGSPINSPNGLEMSRPAGQSLVSRQSQMPGWPGRLHRVVRCKSQASLPPVCQASVTGNYSFFSGW
jgi:hypothetical protein